MAPGGERGDLLGKQEALERVKRLRDQSDTARYEETNIANRKETERPGVPFTHCAKATKGYTREGVQSRNIRGGGRNQNHNRAARGAHWIVGPTPTCRLDISPFTGTLPAGRRLCLSRQDVIFA